MTIEARQRARGGHRLKLLLKSLARSIVSAIASPRSAGQGIGVLFEPAQALGRRQVLALSLRVELGHDPIELRDRAAQALAVLLREFRPLRADQGGEKGDRQGKSVHNNDRPLDVADDNGLYPARAAPS